MQAATQAAAHLATKSEIQPQPGSKLGSKMRGAAQQVKKGGLAGCLGSWIIHSTNPTHHPSTHRWTSPLATLASQRDACIAFPFFI